MRRECRRVDALLTRYLAGELPEATSARVRQHLEVCEACRSHCFSHRGADAALRRFAQQVRQETCPPRVWEGLQSQLEPSAPLPTMSGWRYAFAGGLAALLLTLAFGWKSMSPRQPAVVAVDQGPRISIAQVEDPVRPAPVHEQQSHVEDPVAPMTAPVLTSLPVESPTEVREPSAPATVRRAAASSTAKKASRPKRTKPRRPQAVAARPKAEPKSNGERTAKGPRGGQAVAEEPQVATVPMVEFVRPRPWDWAPAQTPASDPAPLPVEYVLGSSPLAPAFVMEADGVPVVPVSAEWSTMSVSM